MKTLSSQYLKTLFLKDTVSTTNQISTYIDEKCGEYVSKSSDSNVGNIQLSGTLSVDNNVYFNPTNGISGVYISGESLNAIIDNKISDTLGPINDILDKLING